MARVDRPRGGGDDVPEWHARGGQVPRALLAWPLGPCTVASGKRGGVVWVVAATGGQLVGCWWASPRVLRGHHAPHRRGPVAAVGWLGGMGGFLATSADGCSKAPGLKGHAELYRKTEKEGMALQLWD